MKNLLINSTNMPDINFEYEGFDYSITRVFVILRLMKKDIPNYDIELSKILNSDTIGRAVMLRHKAFKDKFNLPEIENRMLLLIDVLSKGNPGTAMLMLLDLCGKVDKDIITINDFVEVYPLGFYTSGTQSNIVNKYVKENKVKFSEMYTLKKG